ncbi:lamin tail domain-containing protein [Streptomyces sp. NPDC048257]|uniref:lamin tail domain-containing protein n=1 Tax=Streptomyces sp. NPDC048257 TaxID=3365526 RepID=UPI00370F7E46
MGSDRALVADAINLRGWTLRDDDGNRYRFDNVRINGRATIRIPTGNGRDTRTDLFQNRRDYVRDNHGDTATLRDDRGRTVDTETWGRRRQPRPAAGPAPPCEPCVSGAPDLLGSGAPLCLSHGAAGCRCERTAPVNRAPAPATPPASTGVRGGWCRSAGPPRVGAAPRVLGVLRGECCWSG